MSEGRPIVSDTGSETSRISEYIDSFVNPLACKHDSYIKNSYEFVERLRNTKLEKDWLLVTGDVSALYTNMHFKRTIDCVKKAFGQNPDPKRPDEAILKLLDISIKNNDFTFNGETFLQLCGTAMGKRYSPGLANLYLLELDDAAVGGLKPEGTKPIIFIRYLDDIFFIWPGTVDSLKSFENYLNGLIPDIKITFEYSKKEISFLDVCVYAADDGSLKTKTFFKKTDTHQLLHTASFHPKHTFKGLIKSQLIRFKRLSSSVEDYNTTCKILFSFLRKRGYNQSTLRKQQYGVWFNEQTNNRRQITTETIPIVVDYCKVGSELVRTYKKILSRDEATRGIRFITAYRNGRNLKQMLVKSRLTAERGKGGAFYGCSAVKCQACRLHAPPSKTCKITHNNTRYSVQGKINCNTRNIIYVVTCEKCGKQYVGETGRSLRDRLNDHKSDIRNKRRTPLATHFNLPDHSVFHVKITPVEVVENRFARLRREQDLQRLFRTQYPLGINNTPVND